MVPPASDRVSRVRPYSGAYPRGLHGFAYGALTLFRRPSQAVPLPWRFVTAPPVSGQGYGLVPQHHMQQRRRGLHMHGFRLDALSLAATRAVSFDFLSSGYLDVSVPRVVRSGRMCSGRARRALPRLGCPIRRSAGQRVCAPRRSLSQLVTSFIDFLCQGIHRAPLVSSSDKYWVVQISCYEKSTWVSIYIICDRDFVDANHLKRTLDQLNPMGIEENRLLLLNQ